jgi:hypothetical protein
VTDLLVFPVGLLVGTYYDEGDAEGRHHEIRRGGNVHDLTDTELAAWVAAHGAPDEIADTPWTDTALLRHLHAQNVPRPAPLVDGLLRRKLLVELSPGTDDAVTFAHTHRVVPTMVGLGNSPEAPWLYSIGQLGQERIQVSRPVFELWTWGHLDRDLWHACEELAALEKIAQERAGDSDPAGGPAEILDGFLGTLHGLLNAQAAYIEPVETPA